MIISDEGEAELLTQCPVSISSNAHLIEDDPMSMPSKYFIGFI